MAFSPKSKMLRGAGKRKPSKSVKPAEPVNDGPEKFETGLTVLTKSADGGSYLAEAPSENEDDTNYTVSPFRMLMKYRPRKGEHVPTEKTRKAVMSATGLGMPKRGIADIMGISLEALENHYEEELLISRHLMMDDIKTNLYNVARDPKHKNSVQAGMFLLSKLGTDEFRDKKTVELSGPDGKPLQIDSQTRTVDPSLLSHEQRDALRDILSSAMKLAQQPAPVQIEAEYKEVEE